MAEINEEKLLEAIQKDDIKVFDSLMENAQYGAYRLGRFPVLSLMYLYNSKKITATYEEKFVKITAWEELKEPTLVAKTFSEKAGKCLRLYLNEVVSPLEMLLILDKQKQLKRVYPLVKPSNAVKDRLKSIYSVKYSLNVEYEGDNIKIDRRPLSSREKKKIATIILCSFLAVAVAVAAPVTAVSLLPERQESTAGGGNTADGENNGTGDGGSGEAKEVTQLSQIDFGKNTTYTLKNDITVPASYAGKKMSCTIAGDGNKLVFERGATLGEFSGKIEGAKIETSGSPLFTVISEKGEISGVTVNVTADIQTSQSSAFVAAANYGKIDGVTLSVSGRVSAVAGSSEVSFGGMVVGNYYTSSTSYGTISNCTVNYSGFSLVGETRANGAFGGIAGYNYGAIQGCRVTGAIESDTFDLAGICVENGGLLREDINEANLSQTSSDEGWSPVVGGIAYVNTDTVWDCENRGALFAKSTGSSEEGTLAVSVAGIVVANYLQYLGYFGYDYYYGQIEGCVNSGAIFAEGNETVIVGGIVAQVGTPISYCMSSGDISAVGKTVYAGGIAGRCEILFYNYWCFVTYCISESKIDVTAEDPSCVGGIVGFVRQGLSGTEYFGGGVQNCIFTGECISKVDYFGSIVGACGREIYRQNSYYSSDVEYHNFDNNYYIGGFSAFGAVVNDAEEFVVVEDKGATVIDGNAEELELYKEITKKLNR